MIPKCSCNLFRRALGPLLLMYSYIEYASLSEEQRETLYKETCKMLDDVKEPLAILESKVVTEIVEKVLEDLHDRKGVGDALDHVEHDSPDIYKELVEELEAIVAKELL